LQKWILRYSPIYMLHFTFYIPYLYNCQMAPTPSKYPWFLRKKAILIFIIFVFIFEILGAITSYQLYQEAEKTGLMNWERILKPLWQAPGVVGMLYLCIVGFWLIFFLRNYRNELLHNIGKDTWRTPKNQGK